MMLLRLSRNRFSRELEVLKFKITTEEKFFVTIENLKTGEQTRVARALLNDVYFENLTEAKEYYIAEVRRHIARLDIRKATALGQIEEVEGIKEM